jgi:hypothetical protein
MRARSWMAALAVIAGCSIALGLARAAQTPAQEKAQDRSNEQAGANAANKSAAPKPAASVIAVVRLNLAIAGLGPEGCDVEVKPGNASCKFRVLNVTETGDLFKKGAERPQHVSSAGFAYMELRDVELRGADRMFTVAVTVREPGQTAKTVYRGFRLPPGAAASTGATAGKVPAFTCYLSSPSKVARLEESATRK